MYTDWKKYLYREVGHWRQWHLEWFKFPRKILVVFYEDLVADLRPILKQFCDFLGVHEKCTEERIKCVSQNSTGNFKRKKNKLSVDPFTSAYHQLIEKHKKVVYNKLNECIDSGKCIGHKLKV